jgi:hypothetical protein
MKKMVLGTMLVLAALGLLTSPAMADSSPSQIASVVSAADQDFLASLAAPVPELAAKRPAIVGKASCSATCGMSTINCPTGTTSCSAVNCGPGVTGHIVCDGVTTSCPTCVTCTQLSDQCEASCNSCVKAFTCSPYKCTCGHPCI